LHYSIARKWKDDFKKAPEAFIKAFRIVMSDK
jgi:hypothetical protein